MTLHKTRNELTSNTKTTVAALLNARVADAIDLALMTKQAHWNLRGRQFIAVHEMLDGFRTEVDGHVDTMAERVVQLGGVVLGTTQTVAHCSTLKAYPTDLVSVEDHIAALGERYGDLANASVILAGCHGSCRRRYLAGAIIHNIARNTLPCISVSLGLPPPVRRTPCNDSLL